ncbi:17241_t:CDS:2, partial [Cetraspora pellucida]
MGELNSSKKNGKSAHISEGRNKGPIDLDKQCGVIQYPKTTPCTRSLTCKTHSVGSKRAVQGRSRRYDELLAEHQKKKAAERPQ